MPYMGGRAFDFFTKKTQSRPPIGDPTYGLRVYVCKLQPEDVVIVPPVLAVVFTPEPGPEALLITEDWEPTPLVFVPAHSPSVEPWEVPTAIYSSETIEPWEVPPGVVYSSEHVEPWNNPPPVVFSSEHTEPWES